MVQVQCYVCLWNWFELKYRKIKEAAEYEIRT